MRSSSLPWQAAALLVCACALALSCSSKDSGSSSTLPSVANNGTAEVPIAPDQMAGATYTKCCAAPEMRSLGVTTCYAVSDTALADPRYVAARGICNVAGTCYFGCSPAVMPGLPVPPGTLPGTGTTRP